MPRTSPATVLLTGASGQIGSQLCSLLHAGGYEGLAVDVHPNAQRRLNCATLEGPITSDGCSSLRPFELSSTSRRSFLPPSVQIPLPPPR